jgi:hypothetical protein
MQLERQAITLRNGEKAWFEYDRNSDFLEIIFQPGEATCAIELTESIILRFDWETNRPLSLGLISASRLIRPTEYGEVHFQLLADEWPDEAQPKIWLMLRTSPLTEFLKLSSYAPAHTHRIIPMATLESAYLMPELA